VRLAGFEPEGGFGSGKKDEGRVLWLLCGFGALTHRGWDLMARYGKVLPD
jgi:hypothetical protein